jgi:hypothetical protein
VSYNFGANLDSYFEFIGAESAKTYTLRVWEQANQNFLNTAWMWNNWGGLSSIDGLILAYMAAENSLLTTLPWIAPVSVPNYTALFSKVADLNNSGTITGADGLLLQHRITNNPDYQPLPEGVRDFQLATVRLENHTDKSYPQAPTSVFTPHGVYQAGSVASSVYWEGVLSGLQDGLNVYNVYLVPTGDLNASFGPTNNKTLSGLAYEGVVNASKGEELVIPVIADRNLNLGAASLGLKYNKQLLEVISAEGFEIKYIDKKAGEVRMSKVDANGFSISQGQVIATLRVKLLADISAGTSFFELLPMTEFVSPNLNIETVTLKTAYIETGSNGSGDISASLLHTIYPNPFNNAATLQYTLPVDSKVKVVVYNNLGQEVATLLDANQQAGAQQLTINKTELQGSGSYFYRIIAEGAQRTYTVRGTFVMTR